MTHFDDPVWKLSSPDPTLSTFYAGSKTGLVSKFTKNPVSYNPSLADISGDFSDLQDFLDDEWIGVAICRDDGPILGVTIVCFSLH